MITLRNTTYVSKQINCSSTTAAVLRAMGNLGISPHYCVTGFEGGELIERPLYTDCQIQLAVARANAARDAKTINQFRQLAADLTVGAEQ